MCINFGKIKNQSDPKKIWSKKAVELKFRHKHSKENRKLHCVHCKIKKTVNMDYTYLNQAAASFDTNCLQNGIDPMSNMPCTYGDLTSCSQMSQAYRYTAAAASMARSYNPVGSGVGHGSAAAAAMGTLHHPGPGSQCSVIGARNHHQDVHRTSMFSTSMGMQCKYFIFMATFSSESNFIWCISNFEIVLSLHFTFITIHIWIDI